MDVMALEEQERMDKAQEEKNHEATKKEIEDLATSISVAAAEEGKKANLDNSKLEDSGALTVAERLQRALRAKIKQA